MTFTVNIVTIRTYKEIVILPMIPLNNFPTSAFYLLVVLFIC